jgi:uncharacterized coiled-coil DUF342 family protein
MQLEKATSRSSEAALAGWISSNDVTLFTMVLVVVIAVFLHAKLTKGARDFLQVSGERDTLSENLQSTASQLDALNDLLDQKSKQLALTQEQRDQLQQQLVEKLNQLAELNAKLDALLAAKGKLESQSATLAAAKESLSKEKADLLARAATLTEQRESLSTTNTSLRDRLETLSSQLADKIRILEELIQERDRLKSQADELGTIVASLKRKLEELNVKLEKAEDDSEAVRVASDSEIRELEAKIAAGDKKAEDYLAQLRRAAELFRGLKAQNEQLQVALTKAEQDRQLQLIEEGRNNRALLGLKGPLQRVAIVFDASGSMREAGASGAGDRWNEAQQIVATWLSYVNMQQCVLIVFSSDVRTFPSDGSLLDVRGEAGKSKRESLLQYLKGVTPDGWTNTHDALRKAYEYKVDTILLFSDGAPTKANSGLFDPAVATQIYQLCRSHPNIPINTIGLGNYFDENLSTFLRSVAKLTGGTFRGQ